MKKIIILTSLTLFLLVGMGLCSQEPSPTPRKESNTPDQPTKQENNFTNPEKQPISTGPIDAIRKMDVTHAQQESSQNQPNKQYSPALYQFLWWVYPADAWTAWFSLALVVVGIITAFFLIYQLTLFREQVALARKEFIATHPPKLCIRAIHLIRGSIQTGGTSNRPWIIRCFIDNVGESTAIIKNSNFTFKKLESPLLPPPPYTNEMHAISEKSIVRGGRIEGVLSIPPDDEVINTFRLYEEALGGGSKGTNANDLYFFGFIDYADSIKNKRRIAFCRQYNVVSKRFAEVDNRDYEYSY